MSDTISKENQEIKQKSKNMKFPKKKLYRIKHRLRCNVIVIVKEGDVFSSRQLKGISVEKARTIIILGDDVNNSPCQYEHKKRLQKNGNGNPQTIKTLMQVSDITALEESKDNQRIVVEITDEGTAQVVDQIIKYKQIDKKCNIVPLRVNEVLGQLLSQFSLMPELNLAYKELFSNKGTTFFVEEKACYDEKDFVKKHFNKHRHSIPLGIMKKGEKSYCYYVAKSEKHVHRLGDISESQYSVRLNKNYWMERKNVIILGHNSNCKEIMKGFSAFRNEWHYKDSSEEILRIIVIDDKEQLEKMNYYKEYPFVIETIAADIFERELICSTIKQFVEQNEEDTSVLILSDDSALNEDIDANALTSLVYIRDIINSQKEENPEFDEGSIDVIVEIIDPKHHDIVSSYSVNNVVISNRYISKMITQIGEKDALYEFYNDILTYDTDNSFESKEIYVKKVSRFFDEVPGKCTVEEFVRTVYHASADMTPAIVLGYIKPGGDLVLFSGDQASMMVELNEKDKLVIYSEH